MRALPILFSAPMVRAILREIEQPGTGKTQTRRVLTRLRRFGPILEFDRSDTPGYDWHFRDKALRWHDLRHADLLKVLPSAAGVSLWVKEGWRDEHPLAIQEWRYSQSGRAGIPGPPPVSYRTIYRADGEPLQIWRNGPHHPYFATNGPADDIAARHPTVCSNFDRADGKGVFWDSARFMPRWASRIKLIVTDVRVQRLNEISDEDAIAEGIERDGETGDFWGADGKGVGGATRRYASARHAFSDLWDSLNSGRGFDWNTNPFVAAYTFQPILGNIDQIEVSP